MYERKINGFHLDDRGDWVADLECGHTQHIRHNPPWTSRPWVTSKEGRESHLGTALVCKKCEEDSLPSEESRQQKKFMELE